MSPLCALIALALPQQGPAEIAHRVEMTPLGPEVVRELRSGGVIRAQARGGQINLVTSPRWQQADSGLFWIAQNVAVGEHGATVMAGKGLNNESVTLYPGGSSTPVFDFSTLGSEDPIVAVADRAGLAAAFASFDMDPGTGYDFEGRVWVFDTAGPGTPLWSYTFPRTLNYFGGGVAISDDGGVVLTWKADPNIQRLRVEAFTAAGAPISSAQLYTTYGTTTYFHSRQTRISDDGSRAYFNIGTEAVIFDIASGTVLHQHSIGGSFDSHAFSGDGTRFAFGFFGYFEVWGETAPGTWAQLAHVSIPGSTYVARLDLNQNGSRCAYTVQRYSPAYDHIETGLYDLGLGADLFRASLDAPGTSYQLVSAGVETDDAGEYVAACSWGDSLNATPEGFVYDAAGNLTCSLDARGSAFGMSLDADGDVFVIGTKSVHANVGGNGGDVICADAYDQELHVLGYPQAGGSVNLMVADTGNAVRVGVADSLGSSMTPLGPSELDLNTLITTLGPMPIPPGGLNQSVNIPSVSSLIGNSVHVQAGITQPGGHLTNKVSVKILP